MAMAMAHGHAGRRKCQLHVTKITFLRLQLLTLNYLPWLSADPFLLYIELYISAPALAPWHSLKDLLRDVC